MITCAVGVDLTFGVHYLLKKKPPAVAPAEPAPVAVAPAAPTFPVYVAPNPNTPNMRPPSLILDYDVEKYTRVGAALYIMGSLPRGFEDFNCIAMSLGVGKYPEYPGYISVYTGTEVDGDMAEATFALVTERLLYFTTKPSQEHGFEYRFEGEFIEKDFTGAAGKNKAVVRGTLTKFRNGRALAEQTVSFRMEELVGD